MITSEIFWFCNSTQNLRSTIYDRNKTHGMLGYIDSAGPLQRLFTTGRNFPRGATFSYQLAESGSQKTKENIIARRKFRLVDNVLKWSISFSIVFVLQLKSGIDSRHKIEI